MLRPTLAQFQVVEIYFDDALGYGSSFLEEVFGGLVRKGFVATDLMKRLVLKTDDDALREEVIQYIKAAQK